MPLVGTFPKDFESNAEFVIRLTEIPCYSMEIRDATYVILNSTIQTPTRIFFGPTKSMPMIQKDFSDIELDPAFSNVLDCMNSKLKPWENCLIPTELNFKIFQRLKIH